MVMAKHTDIVHREGNISTAERIVRALIAISMLFYPMLSDLSQLDWISLLPLIAIYPMFTAVVGWDPVMFVIETGEHAGRSNQVRTAARIILASVGALMIAATLTAPTGRIGYYSLPALFGILPVFIAILGENPIQALRASIADLQSFDKNESGQVVEKGLESKFDESAEEIIESSHTFDIRQRAA